MKIKKSWLLLGGLALGAYMLWGRKSAPAQIAPAGGAQPQAPATLEECLKTRDVGTCAKLGFESAGKVVDAVANEMKGMDGVAHSSLEGQLSGVGAYSGLGGTFYAQGY